ncbi:MAG TPA: hypothetical protein VIG74_01220, partial [Alphaproteobacteria bacterium]
RLRLSFRVFLVVALLSSLSLLALNMVGGNGPALKQGVEDYLRQITGMEPAIGRFDRISFFPSVSGDLGDIHFGPGGEQLRIGGLKFSMGFWDIMFSTGRVRDLEITDAWAPPGLYARDAISFDRIGIDPVEDDPDAALLSAQGKYGPDPFTIKLGLHRKARGDGRSVYSRTGKSSIHGESPFLTFAGAMARDHGRMKFSFSSIGAPDKILEGIAYIGNEKGQAVLSADLKSAVARDEAIKSLHYVYCRVAPPGKALMPGLALGTVIIDGTPAAFSTDCQAGKKP